MSATSSEAERLAAGVAAAVAIATAVLRLHATSLVFVHWSDARLGPSLPKWHVYAVFALHHIYQAWRSKKVLSLVSFDVKGAYYGVCKERLIERLAARGIPGDLVRWIAAFCSDRTAIVVVNRYSSPRTALQQAGLP
jgi:hypothetical protein